MLLRARTLSCLICRHASSKRSGGRYGGFGARCRDVPRYQLALTRRFTRVMAKTFGVDTGIDDTMLLLGAVALRQPRLDAKKRQQLGKIYAERLMQVLAEEPLTQSLRLNITKVDVPANMQELRVHWKCRGDDEGDSAIADTLAIARYSLEQRLCESVISGRAPPLRFEPDRSHLIEAVLDTQIELNLHVQEMNRLFEMADYGMQYRAVSQTGAVLGSMADDGTPKTEKRPPGWRKKNKDPESGDVHDSSKNEDNPKK